jgi:protein-tyrosine phosphatase
MTSYYGQGTYGGSSFESGCDHNSITEVMVLGKAHIWAGSRSEVEKEASWDLVVSLLGHGSVNIVAPVKMNVQAQAILPHSLTDWAPIPVLSVEWSDGGVPPMDEQWWDIFYDALLHKVEGDVAIFCQGGHGRTGTALSILAAKAGLLKKGCPVLWVRKNYCAKAVETTQQINYVEQMGGVKVKALSSYMVQQQKREAEEKERARKAKENPTSPAITEVGQPPSGPSSGQETTKDEWVWDNQSNSLVRKSELNQDWDGSHWGSM